MWWCRGWLLNTLNYQIEKNLRESIYKNEAYRENRWNIIERQVLQWSASPLKYVFLLGVAWLSSMICMYFLLPEIRQLIPHWRQPWDELIKWQGTFLGGQLTIIGLIFPLVAGFVGVLLRSKSASRALWSIYSHHSGFMFTGLSGLTLSAIIVFGQLAHPWLGHSIEVVFSIGVSFWLLFNIASSGWFLYATFRFVETDNQNNMVLRYCMNETLITEIESRLSQLIPMMATETGLLPLNKEEGGAPQVCSLSFSHDNVNQYEISFKRRRYLKNIRFRLLSVYIWFWKQTSSPSAVGNKEPTLVLPLSDKTQADKKWVLARSNSSTFGRIDRFLIRSCYTFSKTPPIKTSNMRPVIHALVGNIEDALREDNIRQFELAMRDMEQWHTDIMAAAAFIIDDREWNNWLLLNDGSFFGNSLFDELLREYYQVSRAVVQYLPKSKQYFEILCALYLHICGYKNTQLARRVVKELISGHYHIWLALVDWHKNVDSDQQDSLLSQQYESALRIFVGSWEKWPHWLPLKNTEWQQSRQAVEPYIHHLECTARQIVSALRHKELAAAEWAADMLVHWYDNAYIGGEPHQYRWRKSLLVYPELGGDVTEALWAKILNGQEHNDADAIRISLSNAWFDMRLVVAAYIFMKPTDEISPGIKKIISSLVDETRLRPSGGIDYIHHRIDSGAKILEAYIRQRSYWKDGNNTYGSWLDGVVGAFGRIEAPEYVSGRIYSGWGAEDIRHLQSAYMAMAISKSNREWTLSDQMFEFLFSDCCELKHREVFVNDLNEWLKPSDDIIEKSKLFLGDAFRPEILEYYKNSISVLIERIKSKNEAEILHAPIDRARLIQFGKYASETAFTIGNGRIPLALFNDIKFVGHMDDVNKYSVNITGYGRSNVAEEIEPNRAVNEEDWLDNIITQSVPLNLFECLINSSNFIENKFDDDRNLIKRVVDDAKTLTKEGYTPILFIGPWNVHDLLDAALWKYGGKTDEIPFAVRKDDGYADSYICHLENIEVYRMPFDKIGYSILTTKECFDLVSFRQIGDGQYVEVEFEEDEKDRAKGSLKLSYWMQPKFKDTPAYKYISTSEEE